jgi:hypothetical protein
MWNWGIENMTYEENYNLSLDFIKGKPTGKLVAQLCDEETTFKMAGKAASRNEIEKIMLDLDFIIPWLWLRPYKELHPGLEIKVTQYNESETVREYISSEGTLREKLIDGNIVEYKIKNPEDLKVFIAQCNKYRIEYDDTLYTTGCASSRGKYPLALRADISPLLKMLMFETGVENFYYLLMDEQELIEEALDKMQHLQRKRYEILASVEADCIVQGENTSTSILSPKYYEKYSMPHIIEYCDYAHSSGKTEIVHMCGLLNDILPMIKATGMDGIHALTSPPVGDVPFEKICEIFPNNFSILGRFNGVYWVGKTKNEIIKELETIVPRKMFLERPFILLAFTSGIQGDLDKDLMNLSGAIKEYGW